MSDEKYTDIPSDYSSSNVFGRKWIVNKGTALWQLSTRTWTLSMWSDDNRANLSLTITEEQAELVLGHIREARKRSAQEIEETP